MVLWQMSDFKQLEAQDNSSLQELLLRHEIPRYGNKEFELWQVQFWLWEVFHGWAELSAEIPYLGHCRSPSITEVFPSLSQQWCRRAALQCRGLNKVVLRSLPLLIFCSFFWEPWLLKGKPATSCCWRQSSVPWGGEGEMWGQICCVWWCTFC